MSNGIIAFFSKYTSSKTVVAALLSMIPVTEIKGSILYVVASEGSVVIPVIAAYLASVTLIAILTWGMPRLLSLSKKVRFVRKVTDMLSDRLIARADSITLRAGAAGEKRAGALTFGVFAFVALPLPMTGVWAGALLSAIVGLDRKHSFFALSAGNFSAGGIVFAVALLAGESAAFVFDVFLLLAISVVLFSLISVFFKRTRRKKSN